MLAPYDPNEWEDQILITRCQFHQMNPGADAPDPPGCTCTGAVVKRAKDGATVGKARGHGVVVAIAAAVAEPVAVPPVAPSLRLVESSPVVASGSTWRRKIAGLLGWR